jgi:porin
MKKLALAASAILALNISSALAEDEVPNFAEDTLTGDWGGLRSAAAQNGYSFTGGLKVDALRSRGGLRDGTKSVSHLDLKLAIDLEKAVGWEGGSALINVIRDAGHGLNDHHVASLMGVTNLEVPFPTTTRLFHPGRHLSS